jgi:hypothetical protein
VHEGGGEETGSGSDLELNDQHPKGVGESTGTDASALAALVGFQRVEEAKKELERLAGGTILRHIFTNEVYQLLADVVENWGGAARLRADRRSA